MIGSSTQVNTVFGFLLTALSLTFSAYSTSKTNVFHYENVEKVNELVLLDSKIILDEENQVVLPTKKNEKIVSGFYHLTLALCSMYMPILLIGFEDKSSIHGEIVFSQVSGFLLYFWTLIAPIMFPNREFT